MILLFTGAGGTGKTTMAKAAAERYGVPLLESSAREVQREFGLRHEDDQLTMSPSDLTALQTAISDRSWDDICKMATVGSCKGYISDRTMACRMAYRVLKGWAHMTEEELLMYEHRALSEFTSANLVVHCPTGLFDPPPGDFRTESNVQREAFDCIVRGIVDRFRPQINIMSMTVADPETRVRHLHSALLNVGAIPPETKDEERLVRH